MVLNPSIRKLLIPVGAFLFVGLSTQSLKLGPWGWLFGTAVALALWLRPHGAPLNPEVPLLQLEARLALGGKTQLALVAVEGERYLVVHGDRGFHLERIEPVAHSCIGSEAPQEAMHSRTASLRDGWMQ